LARPGTAADGPGIDVARQVIACRDLAKKWPRQLDIFDLNREVLRDVTIEILHHGPGPWDAAGLAAYYRNVARPNPASSLAL
jgi:hypothetical protein